MRPVFGPRWNLPSRNCRLLRTRGAGEGLRASMPASAPCEFDQWKGVRCGRSQERESYAVGSDVKSQGRAEQLFALSAWGYSPGLYQTGGINLGQYLKYPPMRMAVAGRTDQILYSIRVG